MKKQNECKFGKVSLAVLLALGCMSTSNVYAQETPTTEPEDDVLSLLEEDENEPVERVVVTGSRIKRAEFTSASPIQVISGEISRELGVFDTTEILQTTTQAAGLQIDNTFSGFVLDNGPGATTVGFRGLGADRTLVLINGRRVAPSGVGGAPTSPDIGVIPSIMIQRIENLFDGASTTYGSDAIAGVANVILRNNFEGFEFQANYNQPGSDGGESTTLGALWGTTGDNYSFSVAGEYQDQQAQSFAQSEFASDCDALLYEDLEGNRYTQLRGQPPQAEPLNNCDIFPLSNRMLVEDDFLGFLYRTPGVTNIGTMNWSESSQSNFGPANNALLGLTLVDTNSDGIIGAGDRTIYDTNGDGLNDFSLQDPFWSYGQSDRVNQSDWLSPTERVSIFLNGDYLFEDASNTRFFYEGLYTRRKSEQFNANLSIFGDRNRHGVNHPFNPCGTDPINGGNCYAGTGFDLFFAPEPFAVQPGALIRGDRDTTLVDVYQYRLVAGLEGNIGIMDDFGEGNWTYEVSLNYGYSSGDLSQSGISESRFQFSIANTVRLADGSISCGEGCVPVNMFSDNIYQEGGGRFTPEEEAYLFDTRFVETEVKQSLISGFITGDAYSLPWNDEIVPLVLGYEFRKDEINTISNNVALEDNLWGFFKDRGAIGSRNLVEFFVETEVPILRGQPYAEELTLTAAARRTDESFYDAENIWSLKGLWRPNTWLTVRGTKGTSFRAPNLRERFLQGISGFASVSDPCVVPLDAREPADPDDITNTAQVYDPENDFRDPNILASCAATGIDATTLGLADGTNQQTQPGVSLESFTTGTEFLDPERSESTTWGMIFENPFSEDFELTFSFTRFDILITDAVVGVGAQFSLNQCYDNPDAPGGISGFCESIRRDEDGFLDEIDTESVNAGFERTSGTDFNIFYQQDFLVGDKELGVTLDVLATQLRSNKFEILGVSDENLGEVAFPEWRINSNIQMSYDDFRLNWAIRYIGEGEVDGIADDYISNTAGCIGLDVLCRPVNYTSSYTVHNMSLAYTKDEYQVVFGIQNVFNTAPPKVDASAGSVFQRRNLPFGVGYDLLGRSMFLSLAYRF